VTPASWRFLLTDILDRHALDNLPSPNRIHRIPCGPPLAPLVSLDLPSVDAAKRWLRALGGTESAPDDAKTVDFGCDYRGWSVLIHGADPTAVAEAMLAPDAAGAG
jgi:hypothetical protein